MPLQFLDEMNVCVVEKCNHLADAIGKIDEAIEQIELLNISVKKQRSDVLSVAERCSELCAQIKIGIYNMGICNINRSMTMIFINEARYFTF